jgi:hypothetical protein
MNAFFGKDEISVQQFQNYINKYDEEIKSDKDYDKMSYNDWDFLYRGSNILTQILLNEYNIYLRYIPLGNVKSINATTSAGASLAPFVFVFNQDHVWGCKFVDEKWYKVDSIGGISLIGTSLDSVLNDVKLGLMIPTDPIQELKYRVCSLDSAIKSEHHLAVIATLFTYFLKNNIQSNTNESMKTFLAKFEKFEKTKDYLILRELIPIK